MNDTMPPNRASFYKNVQAIKKIHSGFQGVPSKKKKKKKKRTREEENDNKINQVGLIDLQLYLLPSGDTLWVEVRAKVGSSRTG